MLWVLRCAKPRASLRSGSIIGTESAVFYTCSPRERAKRRRKETGVCRTQFVAARTRQGSGAPLSRRYYPLLSRPVPVLSVPRGVRGFLDHVEFMSLFFSKLAKTFAVLICNLLLCVYITHMSPCSPCSRAPTICMFFRGFHQPPPRLVCCVYVMIRTYIHTSALLGLLSAVRRDLPVATAVQSVVSIFGPMSVCSP